MATKMLKCAYHWQDGVRALLAPFCFPPQSHIALMMNTLRKIITLLSLSAVLVTCTEHQPVTIVSTPHAPKPISPSLPQYRPPSHPLGHRTVTDVVQMYGPYATRKLSQYFAQAHVAYPPQEMIFVALKQEKKFELWARDNKEFRLIHSYRIKAASGGAGPKLRLGDKQVPEGIYRIEGLNPNSHYHLSMRLNYPNEFDLFHASQEGRSQPGSDIFIHGKAVSIGCLAMGDESIEELFTLTAQVGVEHVKVVIAPHDPRLYPLKANLATMPYWTSGLYERISQEINALSTPGKRVQATRTPVMVH